MKIYKLSVETEYFLVIHEDVNKAIEYLASEMLIDIQDIESCSEINDNTYEMRDEYGNVVDFENITTSTNFPCIIASTLE